MWPEDQIFANLWTKEVQKLRKDFKRPTTYSCLCNEHFTEDMFDVSCVMARKMGFSWRLKLRPEAVPIIKRPTECNVRTTEVVDVASTSKSCERTAFNKRQRKRVIILIYLPIL